MIRLIIADIEGVLTPAGGSEVPWNLEGLLKIRRFIDDNRDKVSFILCSGRQSSYAEALIQALGLFFAFPPNTAQRVSALWKTRLISWPSIVESGTCFYDPLAKRVIANPEMTKAQIGIIEQIKRETIPRLVENTGCQIESGKNFCISLNPPVVDSHSTARMPISHFFLLVKEHLQRFEEILEIKHSASAVDIVPRGISKASAVRYFLRSTNVDPSQVLGVGDTEADEDWLNIVRWSATPANGRDALKNVHYISPHETEKGFGDILVNLENHKFEKVGPLDVIPH